MEFKTCTNCKKEFPKTEEYFRKRGEKKYNFFRSNCKKCFDEKSRLRQREFYKNNTEKEKERHKYFYYRDLDYTHKKQRESYIRNIDSRKEYDKLRTEILTDTVIKNRITQNLKINRNEIPKELIETKRLITQLKRTIKK